jgi:PadR family transcriptional regulator PadR
MKADALRGHLDALVMAVLEGEPLHGYGIIEALQRRSGGALDVPTGTVYPALHRLERAGMISSTWTTEAGRRRRVYALTRTGKRALAEERGNWRDLAEVITSILAGARP